jgi:hypothetical protein
MGDDWKFEQLPKDNAKIRYLTRYGEVDCLRITSNHRNQLRLRVPKARIRNHVIFSLCEAHVILLSWSQALFAQRDLIWCFHRPCIHTVQSENSNSSTQSRIAEQNSEPFTITIYRMAIERIPVEDYV